MRITPIISRHNGIELAELGAGGGQGDLNQQHELDMRDTAAVGQLMAFCTTKFQGQPQLLASVLQMLSSAIRDQQQSITLDDFSLMTESQAENDGDCLDDLPIEKLVPALAKVVTKMKQKQTQSKDRPVPQSSTRADGLPKRIVSSPIDLTHLR